MKHFSDMSRPRLAANSQSCSDVLLCCVAGLWLALAPMCKTPEDPCIEYKQELAARRDSLLEQMTLLEARGDSLSNKRSQIEELHGECRLTLGKLRRELEILEHEMEKAKTDEHACRNQWCFFWDASCRAQRQSAIERCKDAQRDIIASQSDIYIKSDSIQLRLEQCGSQIRALDYNLEKNWRHIQNTRIMVDSCNARHARPCQGQKTTLNYM